MIIVREVCRMEVEALDCRVSSCEFFLAGLPTDKAGNFFFAGERAAASEYFRQNPCMNFFSIDNFHTTFLSRLTFAT